jgi:putative solute:sodium symporter small subunit
MSEDSQGMTREKAVAYWKENVRLIIILLVIWAVVSYGFGILLAPALNNLSIGNLPMGFWFAQQGSLYVFIIEIFVYAWLMDRTDKKYGVNV